MRFFYGTCALAVCVLTLAPLHAAPGCNEYAPCRDARRQKHNRKQKLLHATSLHHPAAIFKTAHLANARCATISVGNYRVSVYNHP